jgi:hypothetical protein
MVIPASTGAPTNPIKPSWTPFFTLSATDDKADVCDTSRIGSIIVG